MNDTQSQMPFDDVFETELSGACLRHDLFTSMERMTPAEYGNGGENLSVNYSFAESPFGNIIVASTAKGLSYLAFEDDEEKALHRLTGMFPHAVIRERQDSIQQNALLIFRYDRNELQEIKLHLKGTDFQFKVWKSLLKIPAGKLSTYGTVAADIGHAKASRAVGTAIGRNPVSYIIPCHRVVRASGALGGYMWGEARKAAIINREAAQTNT